MPILAAMHTYYFTPTDHAATSVDEFLASCRSMPEVAGEHFAAGWFEPWLRDQGRADLANRAAKARLAEDGLAKFLRSARRSPRRKAA